MNHQAGMIRPSAFEDLDDDVPFDERSVGQPKQELKSQSLCRPRSHSVVRPSLLKPVDIARAATHTGLNAGVRQTALISRQAVPSSSPSNVGFVPKTTTYTPVPTKSNSNKTKNNIANIVNENSDDDSSLFSDSSDSSSSFGSVVSSLSGVFGRVEHSGKEDDGTSYIQDSVGTTTLIDEEDYTNDTFSVVQTSVGTTTLIEEEDYTNATFSHLGTETVVDTEYEGTNDGKNDCTSETSSQHSLETKSFQEKKDPSSADKAEDDAYVDFRSQEDRRPNACRMICCVDDSDSVDLEDFLEIHNRQKRCRKKTKKVQPTKPKSSVSYFCQSLDCLGVMHCFWKKEESLDATAKASDFDGNSVY